MTSMDEQSLKDYHEEIRLSGALESAKTAQSEWGKNTSKLLGGALVGSLNALASASGKRTAQFAKPFIGTIGFFLGAGKIFVDAFQAHEKLKTASEELDEFRRQHSPSATPKPVPTAASGPVVESSAPAKAAAAGDKVSTTVPVASAFAGARSGGAPAGASVVHNTVPGGMSLAAAPISAPDFRFP